MRDIDTFSSTRNMPSCKIPYRYLVNGCMNDIEQHVERCRGGMCLRGTDSAQKHSYIFKVVYGIVRLFTNVGHGACIYKRIEY
jgi:hypothetical protein